MSHKTTATPGTKSSPPIDLARLTDQQLAIHTQGLYARLDDGYAKCQAADDDTRLLWEPRWGVAAVWDGPARGLLAEYEAACCELRYRGLALDPRTRAVARRGEGA